jgi:hypothetical protein
VQANGHDTHRVIRLPGPGQFCRDDVFAARCGDLQKSAGAPAETHGWIERPLGRIFDSLDAFGKFQAPGVSGGGTAGNGKRDDFPGLAFDI